jgi:hypothetical protein
MREWTPNSRYGAHAFGLKDFDQFLEARESILPWIEAFSPYALVSSDDPPIFMSYDSPPAIGQEQKDPTHSANFGVKLKEHCEALGIDCQLTYPGSAHPSFKNATDYLIATLAGSGSLL